MRIVVLGAKGMLGQALLTICADRGIEVQGFDLPAVDITRPKTLTKMAPSDVVIDCAAYTRVDDAESDEAAAFSINRDGTRNVAEWCAQNSARMVFLSTDYIFDGGKGTPYVEEDAAHPLSVYGRSKWEGEQCVREIAPNSLIVRTQALFGPGGKNFVEIIRSRAEQEGETLRIVCDQMTCPTYTFHLADAILHLLDRNKRGTVHVSASESCTWYDFAAEITARIRAEIEIMPVRSSEYVAPAPRPAYSVLDKGLYESWTDLRMPSWEAGLDAYLTLERSSISG